MLIDDLGLLQQLHQGFQLAVYIANYVSRGGYLHSLSLQHQTDIMRAEAPTTSLASRQWQAGPAMSKKLPIALQHSVPHPTPFSKQARGNRAI
jgi:hypothetical protein